MMESSPIHTAYWAGEDLLEAQQPGKGWFALEKKGCGFGGALVWAAFHLGPQGTELHAHPTHVRGFLQTDPPANPLLTIAGSLCPKEQTQQHPEVL